VVCFTYVASAIFTLYAIDTLCHLLQISFWSGSHEPALKGMFHSEGHPNLPIPYVFEFLWNTFHIRYIHGTHGLNIFAWKISVLQVNSWINETLGIIVQLKMAPEGTNFITQILAFLPYGASSFVKTQN
jgi:hypothetical protein